VHAIEDFRDVHLHRYALALRDIASDRLDRIVGRMARPITVTTGREARIDERGENWRDGWLTQPVVDGGDTSGPDPLTVTLWYLHSPER
jgi:hypothetical protein